MAKGESSDIAGSTAKATGAVHLFLGSSSGVSMDDDKVIHGGQMQTNGKVPILGDSLAWGDFDDDEIPDLAVETGGFAELLPPTRSSSVAPGV